MKKQTQGEDAGKDKEGGKSFCFGGRQCDQIWQNFDTVANVYKSLANFGRFISQLAKW